MTLALWVLAALVAAAAAAIGLLGREAGRLRRDCVTSGLLRTFGPAREAAGQDPRSLLQWYPLARAARQLWPGECASLDAAMGRPFPFSRDELDAAHAQWTAAWLAWERSHDSEYKLKAATLEEQLLAARPQAAGGAGPALTPLDRARLEAIEREKLERYQERYQEYVRISRALAALDPERPAKK